LSEFTRLEGTIPLGRFGHAMAKLGDINGDELEGHCSKHYCLFPQFSSFPLVDVAISAPFGEQSGTVYIYVGANDDNNVLFQQAPVQVSVCVLQYASVFPVRSHVIKMTYSK